MNRPSICQRPCWQEVPAWSYVPKPPQTQLSTDTTSQYQGSHILTTLLEHPSFTAVYAYTRKALPAYPNTAKLQALEISDSALWPAQFPAAQPTLFLSALGTTRAAAGGTAAQRAIDYDLNLALARAAHERGARTYVLVSSAGADTKSSLFYPRMKGELEEAVRALGFAHCVILRPGLLVGERAESRPAEWVVRQLAKGLGALGHVLVDSWAQEAGVVARAAVSAGLQCVEGKREEGVWVLDQKEIVKLGRTEWTGK